MTLETKTVSLTKKDVGEILMALEYWQGALEECHQDMIEHSDFEAATDFRNQIIQVNRIRKSFS